MLTSPRLAARLRTGLAALTLTAVALTGCAKAPLTTPKAAPTPAAAKPAAVTPVAAPKRVATATVAATTAVETTAAKPAAPALEATRDVAVKPKPAAPGKPVAKKGRSVEAYRGLGSWVDIYDDRAWKDPVATVTDMDRHGVKTLYIETANSRAKFAVKDPAKMATFIRTAHANGMKVVAWYLPQLSNETLDLTRIKAAIEFRTSDGQRFDSFALDIEADAVKDVAQRNRILAHLSDRIREVAGRDYTLGAITPSPVGVSKDYSNWNPFPFTMLASKYDVFLPMTYYTWHGEGNVAARNDVLQGVRIMRSKAGCADTPIHLIGGMAQESTPSETRAFVGVQRDTGCIGASLYAWSGTTAATWQQLEAVK